MPNMPQILKLIESSSLEELKLLEKLGEMNDTELSLPDKHDMLMAAARSGSVEMMKFLVEEKQLPIRDFVEQQMAEQEKFVREHHPDLVRMSRDKQIKKTLFGTIVGSDKVKNAILLLKYLFHGLKLTPSEMMIKELCACTRRDGMQLSAYLYIHLEKPPYDSYLARRMNLLANYPDLLTLEGLFEIYNTPLIQEGNIYLDFNHNFFKEKIEDRINEYLAQDFAGSISSLTASGNKEAITGALFYFCSRRVKCPDLVVDWLEKGFDVDTQNCVGATLANFAAWDGNFEIVKILLDRGADPDFPDIEGRTLINSLDRYKYADEDYFEWVSKYAKDFTNSLRYDSNKFLGLGSTEETERILKVTKGEIGGMTVAELVENSFITKNWPRYMSHPPRKDHYDPYSPNIVMLFRCLTTHNARKLVALLRNDEFIHKLKLDKPDCTFFTGKRRVDVFLKKFNEIDASIMSPEEKAKRLTILPSGEISPYAAQMRTLFAQKKLNNFNRESSRELSIEFKPAF